MTGELTRKTANDNGVRFADALKRERKTPAHNPSSIGRWQLALVIIGAMAIAVAMAVAFAEAI